ncbi:hypothetical protein U2F10_21560 [Leptothoe sp. EHU-05/26/07-4]
MNPTKPGAVRGNLSPGEPSGPPNRAEFVRELDESHEAGGSTGQSQSWRTSGPLNRAEFVRELIDHCAGAVFLTACLKKCLSIVRFQNFIR